MFPELLPAETDIEFDVEEPDQPIGKDQLKVAPTTFVTE